MARMASHDPSMRPHDDAPIAASARLARDTHAPITTRRVVFNTRHVELMRIFGFVVVPRPAVRVDERNECENARMMDE